MKTEDIKRAIAVLEDSAVPSVDGFYMTTVSTLFWIWRMDFLYPGLRRGGKYRTKRRARRYEAKD